MNSPPTIYSPTPAVPRMGPWIENGELKVRAWAPDRRALELVLYEEDGRTVRRSVEMVPEPGGYFFARVPALAPAGPPLYKVRLDGEGPFPDPWSLCQPQGVHGPSSVVWGSWTWTDGSWRGVPLEGLVLYEVHVGTATREGTFDALIEHLPAIRSLGATALELLPVASFPGSRNWGYDGVSLFAPSEAYGGPLALCRLVDAAHGHGLAVIIDAVYNHFGPSGNYLSAYSKRYFTSEHPTPWGDAIRYAGKDSDVVRELALSNAQMWIRDYHADGLRLDATHAIIDDGPRHLLMELGERARAAAPERQVLVMAEDDRNEVRLVTPIDQGGFGLDAVWADDFHHQLRRAFAGDDAGYFQDYTGSSADIVTTLNEGWFYQGQRSAHANAPRGTPARAAAPQRFIHCIQNHDQVGNRPLGNRLAEDVSPAAYRAMSALLMLSPCTPLIFAGQEWNTATPFLYFTDHDAELGKAITEGRRKEFASFARLANALVPDPQAGETFERSKLDWTETREPAHAAILTLYRELLLWRHTHPALQERARGSYEARALSDTAFELERRGGGRSLRLIVNVRGQHRLSPPLPLTDSGGWKALLFTEERRFGGALALWNPSRPPSTLEGPCALLLELA